MPRFQFASLAAAAALALAAFAGPVISSADQSASVTIHDSGEATTWGYTASSLTIEAGQAVTWTNSGVMPHDAAATDGSWATPLLNNGQSASYTFTTPGTYAYICTPHPWMKGTIIVTAAVPIAVPTEVAAVPEPTAVPSDAVTAPVDAGQPVDMAPPADDGTGG